MLELHILAQDIRETHYTSRDCAITRALHRAGRTDLRDAGIEILDEQSKRIIGAGDSNYLELRERVRAMYRGASEQVYGKGYEVLEPQDFIYQLDI